MFELDRWKKLLGIREINILLALIFICILTSILNPSFLTAYNLQSIAKQIAIFGIIAVGETFVIITAGIDLSPGALIALTCVLVAWFMKNGLGVAGAIPAVIAITVLVGIWHGFFVSKLKVPPFVITLGTLTIGRGVAAVVTKGWPVVNLPQSFLFIGQANIFGVPFPAIILLIVIAITIFILRFTVLGRHIYAVGGNLEAARRAGVHINKVRIFAYCTSAVAAGIVGIIVASRISAGNANVAQMYELYAIAGAVIGGTSLFGGEGTVLGALIGASIITVIWNSLVLLKVSAYWHEVALGLVLVASVTYDILRQRRRES